MSNQHLMSAARDIKNDDERKPSSVIVCFGNNKITVSTVNSTMHHKQLTSYEWSVVQDMKKTHTRRTTKANQSSQQHQAMEVLEGYRLSRSRGEGIEFHVILSQ